MRTQLGAKTPPPTHPPPTPKRTYDVDTTTFPFLKLPRELRDEIYEYALTLPDDPQELLITKHTIAQPALLRTCRQIRLEASPYYYYLTGNRFRFATAKRFDIQGCLTFYCQYITAVGIDTPVSEEFRMYGAVQNRRAEVEFKGWDSIVKRLKKCHPWEAERDGEWVVFCFGGCC